MSWPPIFLSHSHQDDEFGVRLVSDLRQALGGDEDAVWYDSAGGLRGGESWWRTILEEIQARPVFLVVLSPVAMNSPWVNDEIDIAWRLKNSPEGKFILPVLYRPCTVRQDIENIQRVSFVTPRVYQDALQDVLKALDGHRHKLEVAGTEVKASGAAPNSLASNPGRVSPEEQVGTPLDLLTPLQLAFQQDLDAFEHYWQGVFLGHDFTSEDFEKYHRLAFEPLPAWQYRWYEAQITARILELGSNMVTRIHTLQERLLLFDLYRGRMRAEFDTERGQQLWHDYTEWKQRRAVGSEDERLQAQAESRPLSKHLTDFCSPNVELWNACAALVNLIREAGNPISPVELHTEPAPILSTEIHSPQERVHSETATSGEDRTRPAIVPMSGPPCVAGPDGVEYFDADGLAEHQQVLLNAGKEAAFNIWGVLFGSKPAEPQHILDRRRTLSYAGPLMAGQEHDVRSSPGRTVVAGDIVITDDPRYTLLAPPEPSLGAMLYQDTPRILVRYTLTYRDVHGHKYATISDFTANHTWQHNFLAGIPKELDELDDEARARLFPTGS